MLNLFFLKCHYYAKLYIYLLILSSFLYVKNASLNAVGELKLNEIELRELYFVHTIIVTTHRIHAKYLFTEFD